MSRSRVSSALAAALTITLPGVALAQFPPAPGGGSSPAPIQDRWPDAPKAPERAPAAAAPAAPAAAPAAPKRTPAQVKILADPEDPLPPERKPAPAPASVVACNGVFAKESTHIKLAMKFDSRNITYGQVDGPEGSKIPGSILFPNDPKRRLEVLWAKEAGRAETSVIAINGKSQWTAPKGMKLGMPLAALEKANGRPFKVSGFDSDGSAGVAGWEGGALANIPGGCKMGMRLIADPKASPDARSAAAGEKEFMSNDEAVRALKPTVVEILIGY